MVSKSTPSSSPAALRLRLHGLRGAREELDAAVEDLFDAPAQQRPGFAADVEVATEVEQRSLADAAAVAFGADQAVGVVDTIVEWYPLLIASQPRATFSSNVRSLVLGLQHVLKADFNSLRPVLIDRAGRRIHGNTRVRSVARRGPRGRPVRRFRPS